MKIKTKNTNLLKDISGHLWTLRMIISGHNDNRLNAIDHGIEEVERLIDKIEIWIKQ